MLSFTYEPIFPPRPKTTGTIWPPVAEQSLGNLSYHRAQENAFCGNVFHTPTGMPYQIKSQQNDSLIRLPTVEEAIKTNSTILSDQPEQANNVFHSSSGQVPAGLHSNTGQLNQVVEQQKKSHCDATCNSVHWQSTLFLDQNVF